MNIGKLWTEFYEIQINGRQIKLQKNTCGSSNDDRASQNREVLSSKDQMKAAQF